MVLGILVSRLGGSSAECQQIALEMGDAEQVEGEIVLLDERLAMAALLFAKTGEGSWQERYEADAAALDRALERAIEQSPPAVAERLRQSTQFANTQLVEIEAEAMELAVTGDTQRAHDLLIEGEYERWRTLFHKGILEHRQGMTRLHQQRLVAAREAESRLLTVFNGSFLVALVLMLYSVWLADKRQRQLLAMASTKLEQTPLVQALDRAPAGIVITDLDTKILYANQYFCELSGHKADALVGAEAGLMKSGQTPDEVYDEMWRALNRGRSWSGRLLNRRRTKGEEYKNYWARLSVSPLLNDAAECVGYIGSQTDISEHVELEQAQELRRSLSAALADVSACLQGSRAFEDRLCDALDEILSVAGFREDLGAALMGAPGAGAGEPMNFAATAAFGQREWSDNGEFERAVGLGEEEGLQLFLGLDNDLLPGDELAGFLLIPFGDEQESRGLLVIGCDGGVVGDPHYSELLDSLARLFGRSVFQWRMTNKLESALSEANLANRAKSDFLANMSHEIRTPMTSILGYSEMLLEADSSAGERERAGRVIRESAQELLGLINGILDISSVESGSLALEREDFSPLDVAREVVASFQERAAEKNIRLDVQLDGALPRSIDSDPMRMRQVLTNLIDNAVKFTEVGGVTLRVGCTEEDGRAALTFEVEDTGIGVPKGQAEAMFEAFCQADISITRRFGGTGLGLTIGRKLARLLGGDVTFKSKVGQGSVFRFRLPAGDLSELEMLEPGDPDCIEFEAREEPNEAASIPYRLLLAEDNNVNQLLIRRILESAGATVDTVANGVQALGAVMGADEAGEPFDAVLMDLMMPEMDGLTATSKLRDAGSQVPIIALTADAMEGTYARCKRAGCDGYATKPIDRPALFGLLSKLVEGQRLKR